MNNKFEVQVATVKNRYLFFRFQLHLKGLIYIFSFLYLNVMGATNGNLIICIFVLPIRVSIFPFFNF